MLELDLLHKKNISQFLFFTPTFIAYKWNTVQLLYKRLALKIYPKEKNWVPTVKTGINYCAEQKNKSLIWCYDMLLYNL